MDHKKASQGLSGTIACNMVPFFPCISLFFLAFRLCLFLFWVVHNHFWFFEGGSRGVYWKVLRWIWRSWRWIWRSWMCLEVLEVDLEVSEVLKA